MDGPIAGFVFFEATCLLDREFYVGDNVGFWRKLWWYLAVPIGEETDEDDD